MREKNDKRWKGYERIVKEKIEESSGERVDGENNE